MKILSELLDCFICLVIMTAYCWVPVAVGGVLLLLGFLLGISFDYEQ